MADEIKAIMSWSGGKDCVYALDKIKNEGRYAVAYLLSIFQAGSKTLNMHGVPEALIEEQAISVGIPLVKIYVDENSNATYEAQLGIAIRKLKAEGINHIIFGDIFLEDLRQYREASLGALGMTCIFPLWKTDSRFIVYDFIAKGYKAITCCTNAKWLSKNWVGRALDKDFVASLPGEVDPCGENGEYHSFCFDGPIFSKSINVKTGSVYFKPLELKMAGVDAKGPVVHGFWYCELCMIFND